MGAVAGLALSSEPIKSSFNDAIMNMEVDHNKPWAVGDLIDLEEKGSLRVNHEYQRGLRWTVSQKQMFIDSIFRGYSIPAFYFHKTVAAKSKNTFYDIVDGQQRIDAIRSFSEGAFELRDPTDNSGLKFPNFMKGDPCPWGGKRFVELSEHHRNQLKSHPIVVYEIKTDNENSIRDLFIRLQGGTPLTPQDKRDSWPGNFTEFVLRVGGKSTVDKWYGCPLFTEIAKVSSESKRRQLVAQIFMLHWVMQTENKFCDIKSANIDEFYHSQVGFDENSKEAKAFLRVCKKLHGAFEGKPKLVGHYLIHLFLFVSQLLEEYASGWENQLAAKWHDFESRRQQAANDIKENKEEGEFDRYYYRYGRHTQTQSDSAATIRLRHAFFVEEVLELLAPVKLDQKRCFSSLERQTVFFRDRELCQWSRMEGIERRVPWDEMEIHHVVPYAEGGKSDIRNAATVHRAHHPRSKQDVAEFGDWWRQNNPDIDIKPSPVVPKNTPVPPDGTRIKKHLGEYQDRKIVLTECSDKTRICSSLSDASKKVTGTSRNGWRDWHLLLPGQDQWMLADDWRRTQSSV
ncbi:MAG: DUF262 domain-containing protein [Rhodobacteraceae bacterium]|nr:DUF262 domain-containing protein [Paracoccaceae bacterium]